ncbi:hypothetical protein THAOC_09131, partial [Thalassiosira oceanica]
LGRQVETKLIEDKAAEIKELPGDQGSIELSHGGRNSSQEGGYFVAEFVAGQLEGDEWRPSKVAGQLEGDEWRPKRYGKDHVRPRKRPKLGEAWKPIPVAVAIGGLRLSSEPGVGCYRTT